MEAVKKQVAQKYLPNIFGFDCEVLGKMQHKPTVRQLFILREIIKMSKWNDMEFFISTRGKKFVWLNYRILFRRLEWMRLSARTLRRDITDLCSIGLIDTYLENLFGKTRIFFHVTKLTESLDTFEG